MSKNYTDQLISISNQWHAFVLKIHDSIGIHHVIATSLPHARAMADGVSPYITEVPAFHLQALYIALSFGAIQ
uniref:Uncharacterized protein n=1 Tax=Arundo donax TaxID=35708 RepID=A0A0A9EMN6_ARUDO